VSSIGGVNNWNSTLLWRSVKCASGIKRVAGNVFLPGGSCRCRFRSVKTAAKKLLSNSMGDNPLTRICAENIFAAMNSRDVSGLAPYIAEEAVFDFPGAGCITGKKRILLFFKVLFRKYPRLTFSIDDIIVDGDRACAVWSNEGEDAHGTPYRNRGITLVRLADGQITFISDYFKDTSFAVSA
jgi:ketosteroid isomerase-like protein